MNGWYYKQKKGLGKAMQLQLMNMVLPLEVVSLWLKTETFKCAKLILLKIKVLQVEFDMLHFKEPELLDNVFRYWVSSLFIMVLVTLMVLLLPMKMKFGILKPEEEHIGLQLRYLQMPVGYKQIVIE